MATGILILFCVAILNFGISNGALTLKHVVVTYRSSEHTPCDFTDGPKITGIPESNSTLTEKGVNRTYNLGATLGDQYKSQLGISGNWKHDDYYSMGTTAPRCLMSAYNFGAGLEKNESKKLTTWDDEQKQKAQKENVTFPHTDQYLKFLFPSKCPAFYKELRKELPKLNETLKKYSDNLTEVSQKYSEVNITYPYTVWLGYEIFQTQNETNATETQWLKPNNWDGLCGYSEDYIFGVESYDKLKKLSGGITVDSILNITESVINGSMPQGKVKEQKSSHKMSVLAVSQAPLAAMLGAFTPNGTKYNGKDFDAKTFYPRNGAHHVVEIYQDDESGNSRRSKRSTSSSSSNFKVRVKYSPGGDGSELSSLKYNGCDGEDGLCTYDQFKKALEGLRLPGSQQDELCKGSGSGSKKSSTKSNKSGK